ncbi:MAG TPA: ATP-binding protein, partial [Flavisolibacter sp.]|nr:ATP-binding protein [Flavisolibacter sp.]
MIATISYNRILLRTIILFFTLGAVSFFLVKGWYLWTALISPFLIYQMVEFFRFQKKTHEEVSQFLEAVHYRDFSRYFDVKHAPADMQPLRQ